MVNDEAVSRGAASLFTTGRSCHSILAIEAPPFLKKNDSCALQSVSQAFD